MNDDLDDSQKLILRRKRNNITLTMKQAENMIASLNTVYLAIDLLGMEPGNPREVAEVATKNVELLIGLLKGEMH